MAASTAPTGVGPIAGAAIMTNGISNIGWGMAVLVNNGKKDIPSGNLQGTGRGIDNYTGNENHSFEKVGTFADFALSLPTGGAIEAPQIAILSADIIGAGNTIETVTELNQDTKQVESSNNSSERTNPTTIESLSSVTNTNPINIKDLVKMEPIKQDHTVSKIIEPLDF